MPGYDVPLQDGVVLHDRLKCHHCQLVMKDPVQTKETGLIFCRGCFDEALKNPQSLQPGDKEAWPDNAVRNEINRIPVLCLYHEVGCEWRGLFKDYFEHIALCECRTDRYKDSDMIIENSEALPVSVSGPAPTEQLMIAVGAQQLSKSTEDVSSIQYYIDSLPSLPMEQTRFNAYMQETVDSIQSMIASLKQNLQEDVIANMQESIFRVQSSLANLQSSFDHFKEEIIEVKTLAVSNNVFCNGKLTWAIRNVNNRIQDAMLGRMVRLFSPPFYTRPDGYKMCVILYLNGRGAREGTHISVFFALMKGEYDALQQWPFEHTVNLILVDQDKKEDITRSFNPTGPDNPLTRPPGTHELNKYSGFGKFAPLSILGDPRYIKDDVMFIRATVDVNTQHYII